MQTLVLFFIIFFFTLWPLCYALFSWNYTLNTKLLYCFEYEQWCCFFIFTLSTVLYFFSAGYIKKLEFLCHFECKLWCYLFYFTLSCHCVITSLQIIIKGLNFCTILNTVVLLLIFFSLSLHCSTFFFTNYTKKLEFLYHFEYKQWCYFLEPFTCCQMHCQAIIPLTEYCLVP